MKRALKFLRWFVAIFVVLLVGGYLALKLMWSDTHGRAPESATGRRTISSVATSTTMVVAAHPLAAEAGYEILAAGGSAIDAAVAVQTALTVVEPQSSGIGGGAFLLYWDASEEALLVYDGREVAPAAAPPGLFLDEDGDEMNFVAAVVGGRSVGVPGVLKMLASAHEAHGLKPWASLFEPAIRLAEEGFEITPRLFLLVHRDPLLRTMPAARAHFYDEDGAAKPVGTRLVNPSLAAVFREVGKDVESFYSGPIAEEMVAAVKAAQRPSLLLAGLNAGMLEMGAPSGIGWLADVHNGGFLTTEDLRAYEPKQREPVCIPFRKLRICGAPPPTSGGITTLQIIALIARQDLEGLSPRSPEFAHLFAEASRIAFADRDRYIADPDFVDVPMAALLAPEYLDERAALIDPKKRAKVVAPGEVGATALVSDTSLELPSTSHFVVADANGDVVSMTTSIENVFGSRILVRGFLLNNELTDFSFSPDKDGTPIANAVVPGKRPRSSMSPLVVFDEDGRPLLAVGSPGGSRIIDYVARAALGVLAFDLTPQEAVELPHIVNRGGGTEIERDGWEDGELKAVKAHLEALGHDVSVRALNSGLHAMMRREGAWHSGIDPRREGAAFGD